VDIVVTALCFLAGAAVGFPAFKRPRANLILAALLLMAAWFVLQATPYSSPVEKNNAFLAGALAFMMTGLLALVMLAVRAQKRGRGK